MAHVSSHSGTPTPRRTIRPRHGRLRYSSSAVLQQEQDAQLRVIGYVSRALTDAERRYCITKKELLGVVYSLKKYRQHLLGRKIVVRTDHAALTFLKKMPEPVG